MSHNPHKTCHHETVNALALLRHLWMIHQQNFSSCNILVSIQNPQSLKFTLYKQFLIWSECQLSMWWLAILYVCKNHLYMLITSPLDKPKLKTMLGVLVVRECGRKWAVKVTLFRPIRNKLSHWSTTKYNTRTTTLFGQLMKLNNALHAWL